MSKFYVGQRVKLVWSVLGNAGITGVVDGFTKDGRVAVVWDQSWTGSRGTRFPPGERGVTAAKNLEPITRPPTCQEILDREALPEWSCPLPETVPARKEAA